MATRKKKQSKSDKVAEFFGAVIVVLLAVSLIFYLIGRLVEGVGAFFRAHAAFGYSLLAVVGLLLILLIRRKTRRKKTAAGPGQSSVGGGITYFDLPSAQSGETYTMKFKVAGVTYRNDDGTERQEILRMVNQDIPPFDDPQMDIIQTTYKGELAFQVFINGVQIGWIAKTDVNYLADRIRLGLVTPNVQLQCDDFENQYGERIYYAHIIMTFLQPNEKQQRQLAKMYSQRSQ